MGCTTLWVTTMHRFSLMTFIVSHPTSLLCFTIVTLSIVTQYPPSHYFIDICNTMCLIFLTAFIATRTPSSEPTTGTSGTAQTHSPPPPSRTPLSSPTPDRCAFHPGEDDSHSFLDLSSDESFHDSDLSVSISSLGDVHSEGEEAGGAVQLIRPPNIPDTNPDVEFSVISGDPASSFRDRSTSSLSSESSFGPFIPNTPGADHDEHEEYISLEVMTFQRGTFRRNPNGSHEDPIIILTDRLTKLNLGSAPSRPTTEITKLQPITQRTNSPTPTGNVDRRPSGSIIIPKLSNCCKLANRTFAPDSWEDYNFRCDCSTSHRFIRPMDEDSFFHSTRLAIDNLTHSRSSHYLFPNQPVDHRTLGDVFKPFGSTAERYFQSRLHDGVIVYESPFGVVDFGSEEDAQAAFSALQGRRIQGERYHWRLEFLDPEDVTFGERLPIIHSEPPLELIRRLDVVVGELERIDDTQGPPSPLSPARAFETPAKKRRCRVGRQERRR